ncbi:ribonuclease H-like domain, reverse transcriptase, RNA-dependent DNA polymerase [Tanacetum coccineum]|uniref:Ribonuclease H-like domain, reverse transcriptase, RNA-dependent DNA polymerase n=1 Tax=Tanacetum coccineum TaxID=301880 RepID=A0ABQ5FMM4_9ASTR
MWTADPPLSQSLKSSPDAGFKPSGDDEKKVTEEPRKEGGDLSKEDERDDQEKDDDVNNTNTVNDVSTNEVNVCYDDEDVGFEDPNFPDRVYKVEKALYRLHQAPRAWYETLSTYLLDNGFQRGKIDKTLFIRKDKCDILLVQVYVDDIIFGSTKKLLCTKFEKMMHKKFQMSSTGELTFFLGLQLKQKNDGIFISQDKIVDFLNANTIKYALKVNPTIYTSCIEQFWATIKAKTVNGEVQLQSLVDGKKIIVTEASIRSDLQLNDEEDEVVYEKRDDNLERVATTATGLDAEQDRGNINKTQSKATPNEPSSPGTSSGGGPKRQETMGDTIAQTRSENDHQTWEKNDDIDKDAEITLVDETQGRYGDDIMFDVSDITGEEIVSTYAPKYNSVSAASKLMFEITLAQALTTLEKRKETLFIQQKEQKRKGTGHHKSSTKGVSKVDEDKETAELKSMMEVIPNEEEIAVDAIPLAIASCTVLSYGASYRYDGHPSVMTGFLRNKDGIGPLIIAAVLIDVNVAQSKLVLLKNFNEDYSKWLRLLVENTDVKVRVTVVKHNLVLLQKLISQLEIHDEIISQEDVNQKFLRILSPEWNAHTIMWRNKLEIDTLSLDDLYNNMKI